MTTNSTTCPVHGIKYIGKGAAKLDSFQCGECLRLSATRGRSKKMSLREFQDIFKPDGYVVNGKMDAKDFAKALVKIAHDDTRSAALAADARRPRGVDKTRFGIAIRANAREPMLNADRKSVSLGLDYNRLNDFAKTSKVLKHKTEAYIVVKPTCLETAKFGRNSAFWGERLWRIMSLKYAPGFVAVTDTGHDTGRFNSIGELFAAIRKSGWERIK